MYTQKNQKKNTDFKDNKFTRFTLGCTGDDQCDNTNCPYCFTPVSNPEDTYCCK